MFKGLETSNNLLKLVGGGGGRGDDFGEDSYQAGDAEEKKICAELMQPHTASMDSVDEARGVASLTDLPPDYDQVEEMRD